MPGSILQVNISKGGVPKRPITKAVVSTLGIEGDEHAHPQFHGGPRQALLLITSEGLEELKKMGYPLYPGALGENITTQGIDRRDLRIGQRMRVGDCVIEFTKIRTPCSTIAHYGPEIHKAVYDEAVKAGDPASPRWGLSGIYASVVTPGTLVPGDVVEILQDPLH